MANAPKRPLVTIEAASYRRTELAFALVLSAKSGQTVRAEPFESIELKVGELFGADPEDDGS